MDMEIPLDNSTDHNAWIEQVKNQYSGTRAFGRIRGGVIWTENLDQEEKPLVPIDPLVLVDVINERGMPLLRGHDPGLPAGRVLAAKAFTDPDGKMFIGAAFGFYEESSRRTFSDIGVEYLTSAPSPSALPPLPDDARIMLQIDPREVDLAWVEDVMSNAPIRIELVEASHNAAEATSELITLGIAFIALVWNPFVTSIATEAGKSVYGALHRWLRTVFEKLIERKSPILQIESNQNGCQVSFLFRGTDINVHYAAHDALPLAAAQAAKLIASMKLKMVPPKSLVYEFDLQARKWFPSYATLHDGGLVADRQILIAIEQLPSSLSLGISKIIG